MSHELTDPAVTPSPGDAGRRDYTVVGMTCEHCVRSVTEEVTGLDGVEAVEVDLASGRLTVTGGSVTEQQVRGAVEEAGYQLAG